MKIKKNLMDDRIEVMRGILAQKMNIHGHAKL
jgi:hypothetical protein